jgi:hypothetical protein
MKKLFRVACSGNCFGITTFSDIYVVADDYKEASDKAIDRMKELKYDKVDDYVSSIELVADEIESNKKLLIL